MRALFTLPILLFAVLAIGCQSDRERYNIQDPEPITIPVGMIPEGLENNFFLLSRPISVAGVSLLYSCSGLPPAISRRNNYNCFPYSVEAHIFSGDYGID